MVVLFQSKQIPDKHIVPNNSAATSFSEGDMELDKKDMLHKNGGEDYGSWNRSGRVSPGHNEEPSLCYREMLKILH